jgi:ribonuclease BN (tRNA processing enzyme)
MKLKVLGYHDMFSLKHGGLENLTVLQTDRKTLVIEAPSHITKTLPNARDIRSNSHISKVDALIITHVDADHVSGLDYLLWSKVFEEKSKLLLITRKEVAKQMWQRVKTAFEISRIDMKTKLEMKDYTESINLELGQKTAIPHFGIEIETFYRSTKHAPFVSIAFKIWKDRKPVLAYSGDTSFDLELIDFLAKGGNYPIIHEAGSYSAKSPAHTSIDELLTLPINTQRRIYLNHIPKTLEKEIKEKIRTADSPIRIANELNKTEE